MTRIERALSEIKVRFARDAEGMAIAQMVHCSHDAVPAADWSKVYPSWILAEKDGETIGCMQVCFGLPAGRLEFLSFIPGLPFRTRALAVMALLNMGTLTLKKHGATAAAGTVDFSQKSFKQVLKNNGCVVATSGNVFMKAVA